MEDMDVVIAMVTAWYPWKPIPLHISVVHKPGKVSQCFKVTRTNVLKIYTLLA